MFTTVKRLINPSVRRSLQMSRAKEQGHPTKSKMRNNRQKHDNETLVKQFLEFFDVAVRKKGVPHFQEDNE